ncbi:MAG TPA: dihydropteroate synthase [Burkholderiaceae bacterium]|nr:dihydropteroate synthase [Burkholderiaceae bacterium]
MGIVNVTPDSFSDGGRFFDASTAIAHARRLIEEGADLIDIGGESTRPDASEVSLDAELARVLPVVEALSEAPVALSIDTSKPQVMRAALSQGASVINDVRSLSQPGALDVVTQSDCGVVLMHMQGTPQTMQIDPRYQDVTAEVGAFLRDRCDAVEAAGIARERIALDPGFGFGKTHAHNFELLAHLGEIAALGRPLLVGISRKGMLKHATGRSVGERTVASAAAALIAVERGACIVRVHDVAATRDALAVWQTTREHLRGQA